MDSRFHGNDIVAELRTIPDFLYSSIWGTTPDRQDYEESKSKLKVFSFLGIVAVFSIYYNFPYLFLKNKIGFTMDDAWIHMTYARNFFYHGNLSFDGIHVSTGTSSLLWPVLLSFFSSLPPNVAVASIHIFNIFIFFLLVRFWYLITSRMFFNESVAYLTAFLVPFSGNLLWLVFSGMESIFFLFLGIAAIYFFGKRKYAAAGILNALMILTRPEGLAMFLTFATIEFYRFVKRGKINRRDILVLLLPPAVAFLSYLGFNFYVDGRFLTSTFQGRRWLYGLPEKVSILPSLYYGSKLLFLGGFNHIITYSTAWGWLDTIPLFRDVLRVHLKTIGSFFFFSGFFFYLISLFEAIRQKYFFSTSSYINNPRGCFLKKNKHWEQVEIPIILWTICHNLSYVVFLPYYGQGLRYVPVNLLWVVIFFVLGLRGWGEILSLIFKKYEKKIKYSLSFLFLFITVIQFWYWGFVYQSSVNHINKIHVKSAEWARRNLPPDAKIAAFDIGAMGFFSGRNIVDMGGLIRPECASYLFKGSIVPYLEKRGVEYIAIVQGKARHNSFSYRLGICQADGMDFFLTSLYEAELEEDETFHRLATHIGCPRITIYKVDWQKI